LLWPGLVLRGVPFQNSDPRPLGEPARTVPTCCCTLNCTISLPIPVLPPDLYCQDRVKFHVLLTTYEMVSKHLADIRRLHWSALLVDEAHRLKSATSKLFQVGFREQLGCQIGIYCFRGGWSGGCVGQHCWLTRRTGSRAQPASCSRWVVVSSAAGQLARLRPHTGVAAPHMAL
jgi:hypothetical protein